MQFLCQLSETVIPSNDALMLFPPKDVPHLLKLDPSSVGMTAHVAPTTNSLDDVAQDKGLLLSGAFTLPLHNTQAHPLTLRFSLVTPSRGVSGTFALRLAKGENSTHDSSQLLQTIIRLFLFR